MNNRDDLCQECENPWEVLILRPDHYCDEVYCQTCAVASIVASNDDQPGYDVASAEAALASMLAEGSAVTP